LEKERGVKKPVDFNRLRVILALVLLWACLLVGGFWYARQYIDQKVLEIQETNALNVQDLEEKMQSLSAEMKIIKESLTQTDKALSSTGTTSKEVKKRIEEMDNQLKELEKSLSVLQESGNEDY
jgi:septal ring factor EnvC (AmiA/AmiB activator)